MGLLKDYARKDIVDIRAYLIDKINEIADNGDGTSKWTDRNESDLGMTFIELMAGVADLLNFNIDKQALETFLLTATQRKNVKGNLALIGYEMKPPVAAVSKCTFTLSQPLDFDLVIPKYFQVSYKRSEGNIYYATKDECQIIAGQTKVTVPVVQGIVTSVSMTVREIYRIQKLAITSTKVAYKSVRIIIDGVEWTQVDDVLTDDEFGTKFSVHEDKNDQAYIEFGYNNKDYLPANVKAPVQIQYLQTEGGNGSLKTGMINTIEDSILIGDTDYARMLTVTNIENATGGSDRESIDTAKSKAPKTVKSHGLMVTLTDYETFTENFPGVYKACAVDWNVNNGEYVSVPYQILIYVITNDNNTYDVSNQFLTELKDYLTPSKWSSIQLICNPAQIKDIDIIVKVHTSTDKTNYVALQRVIEDAYKDYFNKFNQDFNARITIGQLESIAKNASNLVEYCEVLAPTETIKLKEIEFPRLDTITVSVGEV